MRKELKRASFVATSLVIGLMSLASLTGAKASGGFGQYPQTSAAYSAGQQVIARVTVRSQKDIRTLTAAGVSVLEGSTERDAYILTTFGTTEQLQRDGWTVEMLFVRDSGAEGKNNISTGTPRRRLRL